MSFILVYPQLPPARVQNLHIIWPDLIAQSDADTTTVFESDGVRYEVEQFPYPLNGPRPERRGDIPMALLQKVKATNLLGQDRTIPVTMSHRRQFSIDCQHKRDAGAQIIVVE